MKNKTNRLHFSTRTIAMILSVIMLIGSIATGSMLNTFAAYLKDAAANCDAVSQAASEGSDIAKSAIPSDDTAAQADNEDDKPDLSGFEENEIVRGMKQDLANTAAASDLASVGYSNGGYVKGQWDGFVEHSINSGYTALNLAADTTYEFCFKSPDNNDYFKKDVTISGSVTKYDFPKDGTVNAKLHTTVAGNYTFKFNSWDGGQSSMRVDITFPEDTTPDTWTVVGDNTSLFGTAWAPTATANDMTKSGNTWTWTKNNVQLTAGTKIEYKIAKNHAWDTTVPADATNLTKTVSAAGTYNVTVTYDGTNVSMALESVAKSTLTVQSNIDHATVTATYNGTTAQEGGTISNIPQGATVSISVTPDSGYKCTGITSTGGGETSGSGKSWTLTMPGSNTTVSVSLATVTMKKIYFNNNYTQYGTVYAYVYDKSGTSHTYEYLGARPGKVMIEPENSEVWYIEVPEDVEYVEFISGDGKTTGEMKIPWPNSGESPTYTYPKYTAPYNYDAPTIANGGTWGNYIWGSTNKRGNEYTVTDGSTMNASNLFTGISATMYDYYVDGEVDGSNGWLQDIGASEYSGGTNWEWHPYDKLNAALSSYADADKTRDNTNWSNSSQPKYGVTYPLYFGNLDTKDGGSAMTTYVNGLYNWHFGTNNAQGLSAENNAAVGLSGKKLGTDNTIHYYKSGATNENGAPMAMFNEDFLSGENSQNKELATILRTSSFPVRKEEHVGGTTSYPNKIYVSAGSFEVENPGGKLWAHFWGGTTTDENHQMTYDSTSGYYICDIPSGSPNNVCFVRTNSAATSIVWSGDNFWNKSEDLSVETSNTSASRLYTFSKYENDIGKFSKGNIGSSYAIHTGGHTYYEFDSTDGKDNAYITDISKSNKTAKINYYTDKKVKSSKGTYGFFPFDYNSYQNNTPSSAIAHDLGFGMKLEIPFTLEANGLNTDGTAQTFDFSGDDDLWVFVDGKLVLDLGGAHGRTTGSINFNTKTVTANNTEAIPSGITAGTDRNGSFATGFNTNPNYVHTMTIYYMERGMFESNLKFGFSFHAIPNQFWIDKKIRTKDKYNLGYDTINSGFFTNNNQSDAASNMTTYTLGDKTTSMTKFEKSYQGEEFTVTQWYGSNGATPTTLAAGKNYTIDYDENTHQTGSDGQYPIKHDLGNAFIAQFTKGDKFKLKETISNSNKYVYTPVFSVWDQANNDKEITASGDNTNGYTFDFAPTTTVTTGIENTNIKARFDNYMVAHDLTLTKEITNATDTTSTFTFQILFDFTGTSSPNYVAYPLYCDVDGARTKLSDDGKITIKAGQTVNIFDIPENAKIQVVELLTDTVAGYRYDGVTVKKGSTTVTPTTVTKGAQFVMGDNDMTMTFSNKKPDNRYTIKYNYTSYDNLYGQQSYTVSGVFTENELKTYLTLDGSGNLAFKTDSLKKGFINKKAPLEDNFMQTLSFADSVVDETNGGGWVNGNYSCQVTAAATTEDKISVSFKLPYDVQSSDPTDSADIYLVPKATSGTVAKKVAQTVGTKNDIACFDWYVTAGASKKTSNWKAEDTTFVKAPLIIYDGNTPYYFQYWSVKKASSYGMPNEAEYTRCYDYEFNLSLFMDTVIEPVYDTTWAQTDNPPTTYNMYNRFDPEKQIAADSTNGISIAFLENSRNQYNNGDDGTENPRDKGAAADVIYSDFLLSFNNFAGKEQLNTRAEGTTKAGLVIEAVGYLNGSNASGFDTTTEYRNETNIGTEGTMKTTIKSWVEGSSTKPNGCAKSEFDVRALDNKNRIQYYYALNNRKLDTTTGNLLNTMQNRYKVFRAYAYIGDVNGSNLKDVIVSDPVYFTIYDMASFGLTPNATVN